MHCLAMCIFLHFPLEPGYLGLKQTYVEFCSLVDLSSMYLVLNLLNLLWNAHC